MCTYHSEYSYYEYGSYHDNTLNRNSWNFTIKCMEIYLFKQWMSTSNVKLVNTFWNSRSISRQWIFMRLCTVNKSPKKMFSSYELALYYLWFYLFLGLLMSFKWFKYLYFFCIMQHNIINTIENLIIVK